MSTDRNFLSPVEFRFTVKRLPETTFTVQRANLPGVSISPIRQNTPFKPIYRTPDSVDMGSLSVDFIVDRDLSNYMEIYNWMVGMTFPEKFDQYTNLIEGEGLYSDATLTLMSGQGNPNKEFTYTDIFPITLGEIQMDTTQSDVQYAVGSVTFQIGGFVVK